MALDHGSFLTTLIQSSSVSIFIGIVSGKSELKLSYRLLDNVADFIYNERCFFCTLELVHLTGFFRKESAKRKKTNDKFLVNMVD